MVQMSSVVFSEHTRVVALGVDDPPYRPEQHGGGRNPGAAQTSTHQQKQSMRIPLQGVLVRTLYDGHIKVDGGTS